MGASSRGGVRLARPFLVVIPTPADTDKSGFGRVIATQSPAITRAFFDQLDERARDRSARSRKLVEDRIVVACG